MNPNKNFGSQQEERRYFQWVVGERRGEVLLFDKIEGEGAEVYIVFKDGSRINEDYIAPLNVTDLSGKYMAEIDSPNNCWNFEEVTPPPKKPRYEIDANTGVKYEIPDVNDVARADLSGDQGIVNPSNTPRQKTIKLIPPRPTPKTSSIFGAIENLQTRRSEESTMLLPPTTLAPIPGKDKKMVDLTDPVYILMSKAKKEDAEVNMSMTISLPPQTLYNIARDSFEGGGEKFIEYIIENIAINDIKDSLKDAIKGMYENVVNDNLSHLDVLGESATFNPIK